MHVQEFTKHVDNFLQHLQKERNLSAHTLRAYRSDLAQFTTFWCQLPHTVPAPSLQRVVERYLVSLFYKKIDKSTIARKFSCFKSLERYLKTADIDLNLHLSRPRIDKKLPVYLSMDEVVHLLDDIPDSALPTKYPQRDKAILELLYSTGVRCAELVNISLQDINMQEKTIRIYGKGKKERMVLFGEKAKAQLITYMLHERPTRHTLDEPLFLNYKGSRITCRSVQRTVCMFRQFLKIERPITPHKLRHSFATHLLQKGTDLRIVQELLGHKTLASTEKYTHVSLQDLIKTCTTKHPINTLHSSDDT